MFPAGTIENKELAAHIFLSNGEFDVKGTGYVVDSLWAAQWTNIYESYEKTVKLAISLGDDTDTTACIAGGIAGLIHGFEAIPERWRENLRGAKIYEPLIGKLLERLG
jgi:ADP-ribosylglycohydrolase